MKYSKKCENYRKYIYYPLLKEFKSYLQQRIYTYKDIEELNTTI